MRRRQFRSFCQHREWRRAGKTFRMRSPGFCRSQTRAKRKVSRTKRQHSPQYRFQLGWR